MTVEDNYAVEECASDGPCAQTDQLPLLLYLPPPIQSAALESLTRLSDVCSTALFRYVAIAWSGARRFCRELLGWLPRTQ
jgi:hypothetical protein